MRLSARQIGEVIVSHDGHPFLHLPLNIPRGPSPYGLFPRLRPGHARHGVAWSAPVRIGKIEDVVGQFDMLQNPSPEYCRLIQHEFLVLRGCATELSLANYLPAQRAVNQRHRDRLALGYMPNQPISPALKHAAASVFEAELIDRRLAFVRVIFTMSMAKPNSGMSISPPRHRCAALPPKAWLGVAPLGGS